MKIKRGTSTKPALRQERENAAFNMVRGILQNNRQDFGVYLRKRVRNYVLKNNGVFKGFAFLEKHKTDPSAIVLALIATTSEPGKGYGRALMDRILADVRRKGYRRLVIHDPLPSVRNFYRKFNAGLAPKAHSPNTTLMEVNLAQANSSGEVTSRRRSPSRPSPRGSSSSSRASPRQSPNRKTPRRQTPPRN
jgi:GNAT superfamily N-acetyltransferase